MGNDDSFKYSDLAKHPEVFACIEYLQVLANDINHLKSPKDDNAKATEHFNRHRGNFLIIGGSASERKGVSGTLLKEVRQFFHNTYEMNTYSPLIGVETCKEIDCSGKTDVQLSNEIFHDLTNPQHNEHFVIRVMLEAMKSDGRIRDFWDEWILPFIHDDKWIKTRLHWTENDVNDLINSRLDPITGRPDYEQIFTEILPEEYVNEYIRTNKKINVSGSFRECFLNDFLDITEEFKRKEGSYTKVLPLRTLYTYIGSAILRAIRDKGKYEILNLHNVSSDNNEVLSEFVYRLTTSDIVLSYRHQGIIATLKEGTNIGDLPKTFIDIFKVVPLDKEAKPVTGTGSKDVGEYVFKKEKDTWKIVFEGKELEPVKHYKGLYYLQYLMSHSGKIFILDIVKIIEQVEERTRVVSSHESGGYTKTTVQGGTDKQGKAEYQQKLKELIIEKESSLKDGQDDESTEVKEIQKQIDILVTRLREYGNINNDSKTEQQRVSKLIKEAIASIKPHNKDLYLHLSSSICKTSKLSYKPGKPIAWIV
ncbi:MAG: hypothetical protein ACUZ8H_10585 [Candidatus Anammoxibacter sp.]